MFRKVFFLSIATTPDDECAVMPAAVSWGGEEWVWEAILPLVEDSESSHTLAQTVGDSHLGRLVFMTGSPVGLMNSKESSCQDQSFTPQP